MSAGSAENVFADGSAAAPALLARAATWPVPLPNLPSEDREAQLLWRVRYRIARAQLGRLFVDARLRTGLVISLSLFFWLGLFLLFYEGFTFIVDNVGVPGIRTMRRRCSSCFIYFSHRSM